MPCANILNVIPKLPAQNPELWDKWVKYVFMFAEMSRAVRKCIRIHIKCQMWYFRIIDVELSFYAGLNTNEIRILLAIDSKGKSHLSFFSFCRNFFFLPISILGNCILLFPNIGWEKSSNRFHFELILNPMRQSLCRQSFIIILCQFHFKWIDIFSIPSFLFYLTNFFETKTFLVSNENHFRLQETLCWIPANLMMKRSYDVIVEWIDYDFKIGMYNVQQLF